MNKEKPSLTIALKLARRELRGGLRGFRIFLACLTLGVAAIASVQSVASGIFSGLRNDGRIILGGDVSLRQLYRGLDAKQLDYLQQNSQAVSNFVELRTMARPVEGEQATLVELKAVDQHYPLFGTVSLNDDLPFSGSLGRQDGQWGAVIDPALQDRLAVGIGDVLRIGELDYHIRGVIEREPDRVGSGNTFGFWPRILISRDSMAETGLLREGSMIYHHYRVQLAPTQALDSFLTDLQNNFPQAAWRIRDYRNAAPRVERVINRLTLFLTLVGLTALLVGGVGVSNAVKAYLDNKLRTIAMLKCIGAPNQTIFQIYLAQLLVLAGVGIVLGLIIGALAPPIAGLVLAQLLPVPIQIGVYPSALLIAAIFGLLTTLTFAIWPLASAHEVPAGALFRDVIQSNRGWPRWPYIAMTVISALLLAGLAIATADNKKFAVWFVLGALATMALFRFAAWLAMFVAKRLGRPRQPGLRLALTNLYRPAAPTANIVLSLGLGLTVLVAIALIESNLSRQVADSIPKQAPAYFFVDVQSDQIDSFSTTLTDIDGTSNLMQVPFLRGRVVKIKGQDPESTMVDKEQAWMIRGDRGLTYSATVPENTEIIAGEWWPEDYAGPPLLSVHKDMIKAFDLALGDTITLNVLGRDITATIANVRDLEWRTMQLNFAMMLSPEPMRHAPHSYLATVAATATADQEIQRQLNKAFPNVTAVRIKDALDKVNELMGSIGAAVRVIAAITLIAGTLVLAGAIAAGHARRVYDSIVLKVLGATRRNVLVAFLLEYGLLGLLTALIAALVGSLTAWAVLTQVMRSEWQFIPSAVLTTVVLCVALTLGLGFIGTWRALSQKAAPLLRND